MISCSAFQLGRDCAYWLHCWKNPDSNTDNNDEEDRTDTTYSCRHYWTKHFIYLVAIFMVVAFVVGSVVHEIQFYRQMILMSLLAPFGALLRWKLSIWNNSKHCVRRLHWLPWGTFSANMLGAIISILCTAFLDRHNDYIFEPWVEALIVAVKVGFAGSLSTVSSLVKEMANLSETFSGHAKSYTYGSLTILGGMFMGLCIYSGIVRSI